MPSGTFLVADRNPNFLDRTVEILTGAGHQVIATSDADEALAALRETRLDGVLVHAELPGMSGFAFCRVAKEADATLPVVIMFSDEGSAAEDEVARAGADNFLVRPLKRSEALYIARDLLARRALLIHTAALSSERDHLRSESDSYPGDGRLQHFELFKRLLHIELKRSRRYGFPLSLLVATLDGKRRPGDRDSLAQAIRGAIRDIDIPVAFGATDVLVVMPHTDLDAALLVAERIRRRVRSGAVLRGYTASIGVVAADRSERVTFAMLLAQATRARKRAAAEGGDRVVG
jgi:diguanylate cyclase (GGDEF)-like protein